MNCGDRLKSWRQALGLTKAEIARQIRISDVAYGYWESGATSPTQDHLASFCKVIGITLERFWGRPPVRRAS